MKLTYRNQIYEVDYVMEDGFPHVSDVSRSGNYLSYIPQEMYDSLQDDLRSNFAERDEMAREEKAYAEYCEKHGK